MTSRFVSTITVKKTELIAQLQKGSVVVVYLLGLIAAVIAVSFLFLIHDSLRLDEAQSIWQASHSLTGTLYVVAQDVHVPMYHILLHYWMVVFGTGVAATRAMSLLFFVLSIPTMYLLARTILSRPWALTVTTLFAFSPFMNWYANETRMYSLLVLFSLLNQYFFSRIVQHKKGWAGYALTAIFGVYSHYFFLFNLITQALFYLFNRKKFAPGTFIKLSLTAFGVVVSLAPWLYYFVTLGLASNTRPLLQAPSTVDFFNVFSQFLFGFQSNMINTIIVSCWPILVALAFFTVKRHLKIEPAKAYLLFAAFVPVLLAYGLSFVVTPFFLSRYMAPVVAPLMVILIWLVSNYAKKVAVVVVGLCVAVTGVAFYLQTTSPLNPQREDYKDAVSYVQQHAKSHDSIALTSPFTVYPFEYYYTGDEQIKTLPLWDRQKPGPIPAFNAATLPAQVKAIAKDHDYVYLLASYDQGYEKQVLTYFSDHYERTYKHQYSVDLTLYVFRVGYNSIPVLQPPSP
ncbi:MAG: glycosyltransferase family 39 protein [Candidatus Saccharimonadales bacterium]